MSFRHLALFVCAFFLTGCGITSTTGTAVSKTLTLTGSMHGGQQPVTGAVIQMYAVGTTGTGSAATPLIGTRITTSDGSGLPNANANAGNNFNQMPAGSFGLTGTFSCATPGTQVYLGGTGGNPGLPAGTNNAALAMISVLGNCGDLQPTTSIQINELTTVASLAPLAQYMSGYTALGSSPAQAPALLGALTLVRSYTDTSTGTIPGPSLQPGYYASMMEVTTLADILAGCVNSDGTTPACQQLFTLATPPGGTAPTDTIGAALNILKFPANNTAAIFALLSPTAPFQPTLTSAPANWSLPILPYTATPVITPQSGSYSIAPTVTITDATPGASIFYSLDGSAPTLPYTAPVSFASSGNTTLTVKAIATTPNYATSAPATATYNVPAAGKPVALTFLTQPMGAAENAILPAFKVGLVDAYGTPVAASGYAISVALSGTSGAITGTRSFNSAKDGTVSFTNLSISPAGVNYSFVATCTQFSGTTVSAPFTITAPPITFNLPGTTIGTGATLTGALTLPSAAPTGGATIALSSGNPGAITVAPASVTVGAGATTGSFTYSYVAPGTATLKATSAAYGDGTTTVTTSTSFITIGTLPTTPVSSQAVTITLSAPAPSGGVTVALSSSNSAVATIASVAVIAAGATQPASPPQVQVKTVGTAQITATATGYAPDTRTLTSAGSATLTQNLTTSVGGSVFSTLAISPTLPTATVFTLKSDNPAIATVPALSTVAANSPNAAFIISGVGVGSTTIHASAPGFGDITTTVSVTGILSVTNGIPAAKFYAAGTVNLTQPTTPVSVTLTSSNPALLLLTTDPSLPGAASITLNNVTGASATFYELGQAPGTATVTASSAQYASAGSSVTVFYPSVVLQNPFATISLQNPAPTFNVSLAVLNSSGGLIGYCLSTTTGYTSAGCGLVPGTSLTVPLVNGTPAAGTLSASSVTLTSAQPNVPIVFTPVAAGSTQITATEPTGFAGNGSYNSMVVAVTQPAFTMPSTNLVAAPGVTAFNTFGVSLPDTNAAGATVTMAVSGGLAALSTDPNVIGSSTLVLTGIKTTIPTIYFQGLAVGTGTFTISSPGYKTASAPLYAGPASLILGQSFAVNATTVDAPYSLSLVLAMSSLKICSVGGVTQCFLTPGTSNQFTINSSNPAVGVVANPLVMAPMTGIATGTFTGLSGGTTTLSVGTPAAPLATPTAIYGPISISATVTQAKVNANATLNTGVSVQVQGGGSLGTVPANAVTVTLSSSNPAVAVLSSSTAALGSGTLTFAGVKALPAYYVQGLSAGTTTLTISAPGYATATSTVTVLNSGITFGVTNAATFTTSAFASATTINLYLAILNANGTVNLTCSTISFCIPNPGASYTVGILNSNPAIGTVVTSPATFAAGASLATTTYLPSDVGTATLTLSQPAGLTASTAYNAGSVTILGDTTSLGDVSIGAGSYTVTSASLGSTPARPVSMTVTLLDPSLARLSLDPAVLGTSSTLTFNNITCFSFYCANGGGPPQFYVQGIAPGFTKIAVSVKGYNPTTATVAVYKMGMTLGAFSTQYITSYPGNPAVITVAGEMSLLDPYSNSIISDCSAVVPCNLNPGITSPQSTLAVDDPSVGTFDPSLLPFNQIGATTFTYNPKSTGITNYSIATQSPGYYMTSTPQKRSGIASTSVKGSVTYGLFILAHDVDSGVGVQVLGHFGLSGTILGYDTTPFTITVADPTVAVISLSPTTAGSAVTTFTTNAYTNFNYYVQGLKAGTTTVTITGAQYLPRTITVTVRPAGFVTRQFDFTAGARFSTTTVLVNFTPAALNDQGQWLANATMNPGVTATVPVTSSNTDAATIVANGTIAGGSATGTFTMHPVAPGQTVFTLGTPTVLTKATTYQSVGATIFNQ